MDIHEWLRLNLIANELKWGAKYWPWVFLTIIWAIWKARNSLVFQGIISYADQIIKHAFAIYATIKLAFSSPTSSTIKEPRFVHWEFPPRSMVKLNCDGFA
ncbi:hypothetical protein CFOL_v3_20216 [Cephalotus follicularis]|uniref:Zf-RVT domain-containing protein n=1 Tax=Cephalotus follicularis TaxID=3775 RepID=A0A1Q3C9K3_CEPFO|nr:hypothetical protein CFOL_v3_20216 [Cephalotus follicularis]